MPSFGDEDGQTLHRSPCAEVIERAQLVNIANQHENQGFLSYEMGFLPLIDPITELPDAFKPWDQLAAVLPALLRDHNIRTKVDQLPLLSATIEVLPDRYLLRASTILSLVAHAYVNAEIGGSPTVPETLLRPWGEITKRLGRSQAHLSVIDLMMYNWQRTSTTCKELSLENLALLIPYTSNTEEQIFFLTQVEILHRATPLLRAVVAAQDAILSENVEALIDALNDMADALHDINRKTLPKIIASPSRKTFIDPVVWSKTVAPLPVPVRTDVLSAGGAASPLFHLMDVLIGRANYNSVLGKEVLHARREFPLHWREVIEAAGEVDIASFVIKKQDVQLSQAWEAMKERYTGSMGLLGLHRRKVFAFLPIAFKVGRSKTIGGFSGDVAQQEWDVVHDALEQSRQERRTRDQTAAVMEPASATTKAAHDPAVAIIEPSYPISALVQHSSPKLGYWFAAGGRVYDATKYLRLHPGGTAIVVNSCGRDVTANLYAVSHFSEPSIAAKLEKLAIGTLHVMHFANNNLCKLYDFVVALAYKIADLHATFSLDAAAILHSRLTGVEDHGQMTEQKRRFVIAAQERLGEQFVPTIAAHAKAAAAQIYSGLEIVFGVLQEERAAVVGLQAGVDTLGECKQQVVTLLKILERGDISTTALSDGERVAVDDVLANLGALLMSVYE